MVGSRRQHQYPSKATRASDMTFAWQAPWKAGRDAMCLFDSVSDLSFSFPRCPYQFLFPWFLTWLRIQYKVRTLSPWLRSDAFLFCISGCFFINSIFDRTYELTVKANEIQSLAWSWWWWRKAGVVTSWSCHRWALTADTPCTPHWYHIITCSLE